MGGIGLGGKDRVVGLLKIAFAHREQRPAVLRSRPVRFDVVLHLDPHALQFLQLPPVRRVLRVRQAVFPALSGQVRQDAVQIFHKAVAWLVHQLQLHQPLRGAPHNAHIVDQPAIALHLCDRVDRYAAQQQQRNEQRNKAALCVSPHDAHPPPLPPAAQVAIAADPAIVVTVKQHYTVIDGNKQVFCDNVMDPVEKRHPHANNEIKQPPGWAAVLIT